MIASKLKVGCYNLPPKIGLVSNLWIMCGFWTTYYVVNLIDLICNTSRKINIDNCRIWTYMQGPFTQLSLIVRLWTNLDNKFPISRAIQKWHPASLVCALWFNKAHCFWKISSFKIANSSKAFTLPSHWEALLVSNTLAKCSCCRVKKVVSRIEDCLRSYYENNTQLSSTHVISEIALLRSITSKSRNRREKKHTKSKKLCWIKRTPSSHSPAKTPIGGSTRLLGWRRGYLIRTHVISSTALSPPKSLNRTFWWGPRRSSFSPFTSPYLHELAAQFPFQVSRTLTILSMNVLRSI